MSETIVLRCPTCGAASGHRLPAEAFPPSEFLREVMAERGWTAELLAERLGWLPSVVYRLLETDVLLRGDMGRQLSAVIGTSPEFWNRLQVLWEQWRAHQPEAPA